jgi:hypothetical protein
MHRVKATDMLALRKLLAERSPDDRRELDERLDRETRRLYVDALPVEWCDGVVLARLLLAAATVLYPGRKAPLTDLGEELALRSYSTVYKLVLAIPSFSFVVRRAGALWSAYHEAGVATVEDLGERSLCLVVREAPELPPPLASVISGTIRALGRITRYKGVVVEEAGDPDAWRWLVGWRARGKGE